MGRLLTGMLLVPLLLAGCGDDDDGPAAGAGRVADVAEVAVADMRLSAAGDLAAFYDRLHPELQALVSRSDYIACQVERRSRNPLPSDVDIDIDVRETYEQGRLTFVLLEVTFTVEGERGSFPWQVGYELVGGVWRLANAPSGSDSCVPGADQLDWG